MARIIPYFLTFIMLVAVTGALPAQDDLIFGNTANTSGKPTNLKKDKSHKRKKVSYWIKNDSKGLLTGNPCMEKVLDELGVQYLVQIKDQAGYKKAIGRWRHNTVFKYKLFFTKGPFWKLKLKKKRRRCRSLTRDMVG